MKDIDTPNISEVIDSVKYSKCIIECFSKTFSKRIKPLVCAIAPNAKPDKRE